MKDVAALAEAVRQIQLQLNKVTDLGLPATRAYRIQREAIFFLYEGGEARKWDIDRPHSAKARQLRRAAIVEGASIGHRRSLLRYDHAIPLATLKDRLRRAAQTPTGMRRVLARYVHGVVLLKEEDDELSRIGLGRTMPIGAAPDDALARYRHARIRFEPADTAKLTRPARPRG